MELWLTLIGWLLGVTKSIIGILLMIYMIRCLGHLNSLLKNKLEFKRK
jgi:hypothetical protein